MSGEVLAVLEKLEAAIIELEMKPEALDEAIAEARGRVREVMRVSNEQQLRDLDPPCQWIGSLLEIVEKGGEQPSQEVVDLLLGPLDFMRRLIFLGHKGSAAAQSPAEPAGLPAAAGGPALAVVQKAEPAAMAQVSARAAPAAIKVETEKLDSLLDILGELVITFALSSRHSALTQAQNHDLQENMTTLGGLLENLELKVASIRMLQLNNLFIRMQRLVRDVAAKVGKNVELVSQGGELELDKGLIEELNDPLIHLLRNAVDHGVEEPDRRQAAGKPLQARLELRAERRDQFLVITVTDDGQGLDRQGILDKALKQGLAVAGKAYTDQEVYRFITEPGFSTAKVVTDISGRGVGLDVVARAVAHMGAEFKIDSTPGQGSLFAIHLPLNRVVSDGITDAIIIAVGGEIYAIPSRQVIEVIPYDPQHIFNIPGGQVFESRGSLRHLLDLAQALGCPPNAASLPTIVVTISVAGQEIGLAGEELLGHQQVVMRSLEKRAFPNSIAISGCALMGDKMGLMLDLEGLASRLDMSSDYFPGYSQAIGEDGS